MYAMQSMDWSSVDINAIRSNLLAPSTSPPAVKPAVSASNPPITAKPTIPVPAPSVEAEIKPVIKSTSPVPSDANTGGATIAAARRRGKVGSGEIFLPSFADADTKPSADFFAEPVLEAPELTDDLPDEADGGDSNVAKSAVEMVDKVVGDDAEIPIFIDAYAQCDACGASEEVSTDGKTECHSPVYDLHHLIADEVSFMSSFFRYKIYQIHGGLYYITSYVLIFIKCSKYIDSSLLQVCVQPKTTSVDIVRATQIFVKDAVALRNGLAEELCMNE